MKSARLFLGLFTAGAFAQQAEFRQLRYEDDFSHLKSDSTRSGYAKSKYVSLSGSGSAFASFGGEARIQYFNIKNEDWAAAPEDRDGYMLNRYLAHADVHFSNGSRAFVQLQSSIASGRPDPDPVEENTLDLHQAFADVSLGDSLRSLTLRGGRQEMMFGSQRLISVREFPNSRLAFDGLRLILKASGLAADLFYAHPVGNRRGIFDDGFNGEARTWGSYATFSAAPPSHNADLYYIGLWKSNAIFGDAVGRELRHSFGTRIWKNKGNWQYDIEAVIQLGSAGGKRITAWTVSSNTACTFANLGLKPQIGFKTELISGDRTPGDDSLETFNPLYPRGAYFGLAGIIGPANLFDMHPELNLELAESLDFGIDYDLFWRFSKSDGIYAPNVQLIYAADSDERFIGAQLAANLSWRPNAFALLKVEGLWFDAGAFLKDAGPGRDIFFSAATLQARF